MIKETHRQHRVGASKKEVHHHKECAHDEGSHNLNCHGLFFLCCQQDDA